jgi:hypothetical protein
MYHVVIKIMKKWWIFMLIGLIIPFRIEANTVFFTWFDTEVEIPLGAPLEPYLLIPYASLNAPYDDPNIYYERNGVNYTYQSVIQTHVVKTYRLDYRVYSPKYKVSSIQTITFKVMDSTPPVFTKVPLYEVPVFTKSVDYLLGLKYEDNYTPTQKLILKVDSNAVNLNQIGVYPVLLTLNDEFGNETKTLTYIRVIDYYAPVITQTKPLIIEPNSTLVISDYFLFKDNYDGVVSTWVHDESVDYQTLGIYPIQIEVYDQSGNVNRLDTTIQIMDRTPPELYLTHKSIQLNIHEPVDLKEWIIKVKDNYSHLTKDDVIIVTDLDINQVGFYEALFEVSDESGLTSSLLVKVYVVDKTAPVITFDPLFIEPYQSYDLMLGIHHNHPYKLHIAVFDHNIQMKSGTYEVVYVCVDTYGNTSIAIRQITVTSIQSSTNLPVLISLGISVLVILSGGIVWIWKKRMS